MFRKRRAVRTVARKQTQLRPLGSLPESDEYEVRPTQGGLGLASLGQGLDAFVFVKAPGLDCDEIFFLAMPNGDLFVEEAGSANVTPLADAVEKKIARPYKALAALQDKDLWTVAAVRIDVERFHFSEGDSLTLAWDEVVTFTVDGEPSTAAVPEELWQLGKRTSPHFELEAHRLDGDLWEVSVTRL